MDIDTQSQVFDVFQTGALHGNTNSMVNLGVAYKNGWSVAQDYAKAREWYEKAAEEGDASAMRELGKLLGVAQDHAKASRASGMKRPLTMATRKP
jgi:TPR repeat protein